MVWSETTHNAMVRIFTCMQVSDESSLYETCFVSLLVLLPMLIFRVRSKQAQLALATSQVDVKFT